MMTCSCPVGINWAAIGARLTSCGRSPTTLTTFTNISPKAGGSLSAPHRTNKHQVRRDGRRRGVWTGSAAIGLQELELPEGSNLSAPGEIQRSMADPDWLDPHQLIVRDLTTDLLITATAVVGSVAALLGWQSPALLLMVLAGIGVVLRQIWRYREEETRTRLLGLGAAPRALLVIGVAMVQLTNVTGNGSRFAAWLAASLLIAVVVSEPLLRQAGNQRVRYVAHLPGLAADPITRDLATLPLPPTPVPRWSAWLWPPWGSRRCGGRCWLHWRSCRPRCLRCMVVGRS